MFIWLCTAWLTSITWIVEFRNAAHQPKFREVKWKVTVVSVKKFSKLEFSNFEASENSWNHYSICNPAFCILCPYITVHCISFTSDFQEDESWNIGEMFLNGPWKKIWHLNKIFAREYNFYVFSLWPEFVGYSKGLGLGEVAMAIYVHPPLSFFAGHVKWQAMRLLAIRFYNSAWEAAFDSHHLPLIAPFSCKDI